MAGSLGLPLIRRSALHAFHLSAGAGMAENNGWHCPDSYGSVDAEVQAVFEQVGLSDISPLAKLDMQGNNAFAALAQWLSPDLSLGLSPDLSLGLSPETLPGRTVVRVTPQALHIDPDTSGLPGGLVCSLARNHARLISSPGTAAAVQSHLEAVTQPAAASACVHLTDVTSSFTAVQIAGPRSRDLLRKLTALDLRPAQFPDLSCAQGSLANVHALVIRADIQTHLSYQVYYGREFGEYVWEALLDAGQEFGALPFGMAAQRQLQG